MHYTKRARLENECYFFFAAAPAPPAPVNTGTAHQPSIIVKRNVADGSSSAPDYVAAAPTLTSSGPGQIPPTPQPQPK